MYRTSHEFQTLKNTVEVLHKLNELMKNDKQIAFTELRFQLPILFRKICADCSVSKTNFAGCLNPHFVFVGYLIYDHICNPNRNCDLKY